MEKQRKSHKKLRSKKIFWIVAAILAPLVILIVYGILAMSRITFANKGLAFTNELRIPVLLNSQTKDGQVYFDDLTTQKGQSNFVGKQTDTYGFNGAYLGPTIRMTKGQVVHMAVQNKIPEETTVHWHGMELPASMDGGPHQTIKPDESWQPTWTVNQPAATLWYHPHQMQKTGEHVYKGLAGMIIIDDEESNKLPLPKTYGLDDLPIIVQDRIINQDGGMPYHGMHHGLTGDGTVGDKILVNGTYAPYRSVPTGKVRLRLLNASNARRYNFGFDDNRTFQQIASDGGLLEKPVALTRLVLAPGERAEIVADFANSQKVKLMSYPINDLSNPIERFVLTAIGSTIDQQQQFNILEFRPDSAVKPQTTGELPAQLATITAPNESSAVHTRQIHLDSNSQINGKQMDMKRVDAIIHKGDTEIWEITNGSAQMHPFHVHGVQFRVLSRHGGQNKTATTEKSWKDTVQVNLGETVKLLVQFGTFADPAHPYMFHCHILEHEDMGMMGQFTVVDDPAYAPNTIDVPDANYHMPAMH